MITSHLLAHLCGHINGQWVSSASDKNLEIRNPATGDTLARVPNMDAVDTTSAIEAAQAAFGGRETPAQRCGWLTRLDQELLANQEALARIITLENGKPLKESLAEVAYAAGFFRFFAGQLHRLEPETLSEPIRGCRWTVYHRPTGVVGVITPWNFPLAMMAKKIAPALGAGCSAVVKPAERTPLTAIAFWHLAERVGISPGRLNLVLGSPEPIGKVLCQHPGVRLISFTGSTEVGRLLLTQAAPHVKRLAMELGGHAPFLVFADAELARAVDELVANKFRAGGQTCVCTNRVYVEQPVMSAFTDLLVERVRTLRVGDGMHPETDVGPLINRAGFDKVAAHVGEALAAGARRWIGEDPPRPAEDWGAFYPPTVLTGVTPQMRVCREETFGPVLALAAFAQESEAMALANRTPYGLSAYVFTGDPERAERVLGNLRFGHVGVNTATGPTPEAPFGGMKQSGFGREGGAEGLMEYVESQVVARP